MRLPTLTSRTLEVPIISVKRFLALYSLIAATEAVIIGDSVVAYYLFLGPIVLWMVLVIRTKMRGGAKATFKPLVPKAPGRNLFLIADFLFHHRTVELTFEPLIVDWRKEYFDALKQDQTWKARWISVRYRFAFACTFIMAMGLSKLFSFFKQISK